MAENCTFCIDAMEESAYWDEDQQELLKSKQLFQSIYLKKIEDNFIGLHKSESEAIDLAKKMIFEGQEVYFNAGIDGDVEMLQDANSLSEEYKEIIYDRHFLLISAPSSNPDKKMNLSDEADARKFQYDKFLARHPAVVREPEMNPIIRSTCFSYDALIREIKTFIHETSTQAHIACVIFNGHGNMHGLILHQEGSAINLDHFIDDVEQIVLERKLSKARLPVPNLVQLVFAQCFAHSRKAVDSKNPDLVLTSFTTTDKPTTTMTVTRRKKLINGLKVRVVVDSSHQELERNAPRIAPENQEKERRPAGRLEDTEVSNPSGSYDQMDTS